MSTDGKNVYEREKLYEQVWNAPVIQVAKLYGVSNVAIKKICKSMNIPTPPNGYWAKLAHGKEVQKIDLPMQSNGRSKIVGCSRENTGDTYRNFNYGSLSFLTQDEQKAFKETVTLFTRGANQLLSGFSYDKDIMNRVHKRCVTSDAQKDRAIEIIDYVVAGLIKLGGRFNDDSTLDIRGEDIAFHLMEQISDASHVFNEFEKTETIKCEKRQGKESIENPPKISKYDHVHNGKLVFIIYSYGKRDTRIGDTSKRKLEDRVPEIIYKFLQLSEERHNTHLETLEMDLKKKEESRLAQLHNQERIKEKEKLELLLNEVNNFDIAMKIRAYTNYVQQRDLNNKNSEWIAWANDKADWYDPTIRKTDEILGIRGHGSDPIPEKKEEPYY